MNQKKNNKTKKLVSVAAFLSLQVLQQQASAQTGVKSSATQYTENLKAEGFVDHKIKNAKLAEQKMSLVAILKGDPVYQNGKGEFFTLNAANGDIKNVPGEEYAKMDYTWKIKKGSVAKTDEHFTIKMKNVISGIKIIGTDINGHIIQETSEGEKFYLDIKTGDIIDWVQKDFILR